MPRTLGEFEQLILLALLDVADEDAYGVPLRDSIERRTSRRVAMGALYTALDRLQARHYVSSRLGSPTAERGGRPKRYYRLEPAGAKALADSLRVLRDMSNGLQQRLDLAVAGSPPRARRGR
jgi:PadR family transcriptional regulator, regulatory protein PadR